MAIPSDDSTPEPSSPPGAATGEQPDRAGRRSPARAAATRSRTTGVTSGGAAAGRPAGRAAAAPSPRGRGTGTRDGASRNGGASVLGPDDAGAPGEPGGWPGAWRGPRPGGRGLYDRRAQRRFERWALPARATSWLLARPEGLLRALGASEPRQVDGRVLNRSLQAMLAVSARVESLAFAAPGPDGSFDPVAMRTQLKRMAKLAMPSRTDVHVVGRTMAGPDGTTLELRVYRRFGTGLGTGPRAAQPGIVYFHGGGWVTGDLDSHDGSCRLLAAVTGCVVAAVDYRLAPEAPFPAAVDDALAAYDWVHEHAEDLGIAPGQVAVMGDSAGGNLAAVVAQRTRAGAGSAPPPIAQVLVYPALDARFDSASMAALGDGFFLTRRSMEYFRSAYLPDPATWEDPSAAPLRADDVTGLAPALVVTAGFDPLHDDGETYAGRLAAAGVEVEYRCYEDQVHGFFGMGIVPDSLALATEVCDAAGRLVRRSLPAEVPAD